MIIGLVGRKQHGKSTIAKMLVQMGCKRIGFADPLKAMCEVLDVPMENETKEIPLEHLCNKSPRYIMQTLGTEWGRQQIGEDIWLRAWAQQQKKYQAVVADDVRFPNEADYIRAIPHAKVYKVVRPNFVCGNDQHISEAGIDECKVDRILINDGSIDDLLSKAMEALITDGLITLGG